MNLEFYQARIRKTMMQRGVERPDASNFQFRDFMQAVSVIDTLEEARMFYRGALEDSRIRDGCLTPEQENGTRSLIVSALELLVPGEDQSERLRMWIDAFGSMDELIPRREIVTG